MRFLRLELQGFKSYEELDLDLAAVDHAAVCGANGAGKSSLAEAIAWALYGEGTADDLVAQTADTCTVTVTFSVDGEVYKVSRGRQRGKKSWLALEYEQPEGQGSLMTGNWTSLSQPKIVDTEREILKRVGMGPEAFRATLYSAQNQVAAMMDMRAGERKALLGSLLGLDRYEEWREAAAREARTMAANVQAAAAADQALSAQLPPLALRILRDPEGAASKVEALVAGLRTREEELTKAINRQAAREQVQRRLTLVERMKQLNVDAQLATDRNAKRAGLRGQLEGSQAVTEALTAAQEAKDDYTGRLAAAKAQATASLAAASARRSTIVTGIAAARTLGQKAATRGAELSAQATALRERANAPHTAEVPCPTCGQAMDAEAHAKVVEVFRNTANDLEPQIREMLAQEAQAEQDILTLEAELAALPVLEEKPVEVEFGNYQPAELARLRGEADGFAAIRGELVGMGDDEDPEALQAQWADLRAQAAALPKDVPDGPTADEVRELIRVESEALGTLRGQLVVHQEAVAKLAEIEAEIEASFTKQQADMSRQRALEVCARAFSRDGIPAMVLDSSIGSIEAAANRQLEQLGSSMRVTLATQRENKTGGGISETLDIIVDDGAYERSIATYSGGEVYRVAIALRLAIAETLTGRAIESLIIDEVTDLDTDGVNALVEILIGLDKQVILVSHSQEEIAAMPQQIVVTRASTVAPSQVVLR